VGDIDFKVISAAENSNKFQKTRFWKEKSVDDVGTLGPTAQATLVYLKRKVVPNISMNSLEEKFDHKHVSNDTPTLMMISIFWEVVLQNHLRHCVNGIW
jgi:hypothetical protein